jgi:hypothetical protein
MALSVAIVLRMTGALAAQTPAVAVPVAHCAVDDPAVLPDLTAAYDAGDAARFAHAVSVLMDFVHRCRAASLDEGAAGFVETIDLKVDYVLLAWPGVGPASERRLNTTLVHSGDGLHGRTLPGIGGGNGPRLVQILLAPSVLDRLAGVYVSEPNANPALGQLPLVAAAIATPLLGALAAQQGPIGARQQSLAASPTSAAPAPAWASIGRVALPFRRATIHVELRASVAPTIAEIREQAFAIGSRAAFLEVPHVPCARALAAEFTAVLGDLAPACADRPQVCRKAADLQFSSRYDAQQSSCAGAAGADTRRNLQALEQVDEAFRTYVNGLDTTLLPATLELSNLPRSRFGFGIASGYLAPARSRAARARIPTV